MTVPHTGRGGTLHLIEFRRNDRDRRPPSRVVTPRLMGDPDPDREAKSAAKFAELAAMDEAVKARKAIRDHNAKPRPNARGVLKG
jgi:hypothetical protein